MQLVTLGSLAWPGVSLTRPKPLLLLAYLALEEPQSRRDLAHLFWPKSADPAVKGSVHAFGTRLALDF